MGMGAHLYLSVGMGFLMAITSFVGMGMCFLQVGANLCYHFVCTCVLFLYKTHSWDVATLLGDKIKRNLRNVQQESPYEVGKVKHAIRLFRTLN